MVSIQFFGGVEEIGGNKILLEDSDTRIWLDFGQSFTMGKDYFIDWLQPRSINGLKDYFEFNLLPKIPGLYSEENLTNTDLPHSDPAFNGVLITHAHYDHCQHIQFLDPRIPIYTGEGTKIFMEAMEESGSLGGLGEHIYKTFRTGNMLKVGDVKVEPIHVDHSIPGAYGYLIHTSKGTVAYSGDMRTHGPRGDMTEDFIDAACEADPIAFITEGTRMEVKSKRRNLTEAQVASGVSDVVREANQSGRMVIYGHSPRDMDRLHTFHTTAVMHGRCIVISTRTAHLLSRLREDIHLDLPDPVKDDAVCVYFRRKKSGAYDEKDYYRWERPFLNKMVSCEDLRKTPEHYMVNLNFQSFAELIDIRPDAGTPYVLSMSEPFGEEDLGVSIFQNWLDHFGLVKHQLHASGHISKAGLADAVERINPDALFPVHTEHPEMFNEFNLNVTEPELGKKYIL